MAICIEDIAHALSLICRGNGHVHRILVSGRALYLLYQEAEAEGLSAKSYIGMLIT